MNNQQTIYFCDDEDSVRESLSYLLENHGFKVSAHGSGPELLAFIDAAPKPLRGVFVLDLDMVPMRGNVVHDELVARDLGRRNPIIFLSGKGNIPTAVAAIGSGALSFVEKPHTEEKLLPLIRQALELEEKWHRVGKRCDFLRSMWDSLTPRQRQVALLKAEGDLTRVIGEKLDIGVRAVEEHWVKVRDKLGVDKGETLATTIAELRACKVDLSVDAGAT